MEREKYNRDMTAFLDVYYTSSNRNITRFERNGSNMFSH